MEAKRAIIVGGGPAGLTAAYELLDRTDIVPVVLEQSGRLGGLSATVEYKGNRIDIGGHRFFSKSDRVMEWWLSLMPVQGKPARDDRILGREVALSNLPGAPDPETSDRMFLVRKRLSRIFFLRKFFDYPVSLNRDTIANLGMARIAKIALSYVKTRLFPVTPETNLEDFFTNRFGGELYRTFFKDYTEKVWGVPCARIRPEWGAQRIKGLSVTASLLHAVKRLAAPDSSLAQKNTETSLIEQFLYPKFGPGQLWEAVADRVAERGGEVRRECQVTGIECRDGRIEAVRGTNLRTGESFRREGDYFFSTMPVRDLVRAFSPAAPEAVRRTADGLAYRDFITVGLLLKRLKVANTTRWRTVNGIIPDNWIYIQERDVKIGRLQIFNNWSPYMVKDPDTVWVGLEYFCDQGDDLWTMPDAKFVRFAAGELAKIGIADEEAVLDGCVLRMEKAYPAYFGSYDRFDIIREYMDRIPNLYLIGRNGMHRYNNTDHSMLTAMVAVENIVNGINSRDNIWAVNTEEEYHESK